MKPDKEILLRCDCGTSEHQLIISYWKDEPEVYVEVFLKKYGFWRRLWYGIKYILGFKSRYGYFDEVILRKDDASKLQDVVNKLNSNLIKGFKPITVREIKDIIEDNKIPDNYIVKYSAEEITIESPDNKESYHVYEE